MFTANENSRRPPAARMPNGKLDLGAPRNDASWFAAPAPSRTGGPSFAQTIGGGGQNRPFDPSEFPSLGGGTQQPGPSTGTWGVNAMRQRSPERRAPYGRGLGRTQDEAPREGFAPGAEGYRFGSGQTNQTANRGAARSPFTAQGQEQEPIGYTGRQEQIPSLTNDGPSSPTTAPQQLGDSSSPSSKRLSDMTDAERYGMPGLIAQLTAGHPDYNPLMNGFDLTKLGVAVDSNEPLINTWPGPFDEQNYVIPDFNLPPAYTVTNVPPLASKIESFSDETLIMIFYQYPRDILQELAAQALYKRDWRWHIKMRCWMMKDNNSHLANFSQAPIRLSEKTERGMYIFFDVNNWRRERKEIILNYDDLDTRPALLQGTGTGAGAGAVAGAAAAGAGGAGSTNGLTGHAAAGAFGTMSGLNVGGGAFGGVGSG